ncbi:cupin domain-containing protein, partial [Kitasatospora sp. NPDC054939]
GCPRPAGAAAADPSRPSATSAPGKHPVILVPAAVPGTAPAFVRLVDPHRLPDAHGGLTVETLPPGVSVEQSPSHRAESVTLVLSGRLRAAGRVLAPGEGLYHPPGSSCALTALPGRPTAVLTVRPRPSGRTAQHRPDPVPLARPAAGPAARPGRGVRVGWLATAGTVGARRVAVARSDFEPGARQELHRHPRADEFLLVLEGGGHHLTAHPEVEVPLHRGDLMFVPAGEWHGFRSHPDTPTVVLHGHLGAADPATAGHQLHTPAHQPA